MAFSVLLTLDRASDSALEELAHELLGPINAGAGVIWTRPHNSLAISETVDVEPLIPLLREIATAHAPIHFAMSSMGFFPGAKRVVFLAPVVTPALPSPPLPASSLARQCGTPRSIA